MIALATFFALLASVVSGWLIEPLPKVDLEVLDRHFVRIPIGSPQHTYTFLLDLSSSGIVISSYHPEVELNSNSYELVGTRRTDLFNIGPYTLRLPYRFGSHSYDRTIQLSSQQNPIGSIGLGQHSPFWRYWGNFSLTRERLRLGESDAFGGEDNLPVLDNGNGFLTNPDTGTVAPMVIDFSIMNLLLPHVLMDEQPSTLSIRNCANPDQCPDEALFTLHSQDILLLSGSIYAAVDQSHDGLVHLGRRFFYDIRLFGDWSTRSFVISDTDDPSNEFNSIYAFLLIFLLCAWLTLQMGHRKMEQLDSTEQFLNSLLEVLILELGFASWLTNFFVFNWSDALHQLLGPILSGFAEAFIHIAMLGGGVMALCLFAFGSRRYKFEWHMLAIVNVILPVAWSSVVLHHRLYVDIGFLLFFSTVLALVNGVIFSIALLFGKRKLSFASGFATLLSYAFLWACNLVPFHKQLLVKQYLFLFIAEYTLLFLLVPTLFVLMHILRNYAKSFYTKWKRHHPVKQKASDNTAGFDPNQAFLLYSETTAPNSAN